MQALGESRLPGLAAGKGAGPAAEGGVSRRTIDGGVADGGVSQLFYDIKVRNAQSVVSWLVGARCG